MNNTETPNTVSELIQQNKEPLSPETIWEEYKKLGVQEQETFILNCVRLMDDFHQFVVQKNVEDDQPITESGGWVVDGTKWNIIHSILNGICS